MSTKQAQCFKTDSQTTEEEELELRRQGYYPAVVMQTGITYWLPVEPTPPTPTNEPSMRPQLEEDIGHATAPTDATPLNTWG